MTTGHPPEEANPEEETQQMVEVNESRIKKLAAFEVANDAKAIVTTWAKWIVGTLTLFVVFLGAKTYRDIHVSIHDATIKQIDHAEERIQKALTKFEVKSKTAIAELENEVEGVKFKAADTRRYLGSLVVSKPKPKNLAVLKNKPLVVGPGSAIAVSTVNGESLVATVCCVVQDAENIQYLLIPNFFPMKSKEVVDRLSSQLIGKRVRDTNQASLVKLASNATSNIGLPTGKNFSGIATATKGEKLRAYGYRSGELEGDVLWVRSRAYVSERKEGVEIETCMYTTMRSAAGDGGGPVVNANNELVGMLYSHTDEGAQVVSIEEILKELDVTLVVSH